MNLKIPSTCKGILPMETTATPTKDPLVSWLNNKNYKNKLPPLRRSVCLSRALFKLMNAKKGKPTTDIQNSVCLFVQTAESTNSASQGVGLRYCIT